jgi:hypothetical protein
VAQNPALAWDEDQAYKETNLHQHTTHNSHSKSQFTASDKETFIIIHLTSTGVALPDGGSDEGPNSGNGGVPGAGDLNTTTKTNLDNVKSLKYHNN